MMGRELLFIYHDYASGFKVGSIKRKVKHIRCSHFEILGFDSARRAVGFGVERENHNSITTNLSFAINVCRAIVPANFKLLLLL